MVIGNKQYDDVELMRGKRVPAERIEFDGRVSLFSFGEENRKKIVKWGSFNEIMLRPDDFYGEKGDKRVRDSLLIDVTKFLDGCK